MMLRHTRAHFQYKRCWVVFFNILKMYKYLLNNSGTTDYDSANGLHQEDQKASMNSLQG